ncbi:hypothetical protein CARUB_v10006748mg [Capsella rubella]|uniref:Protein kinase domain-containing protein n=1 Tax=Capsella rubella TaxID=81985 RepID=R0H0W4_9BRAS|nr:probable LRR receptor-like serine/threonine-protein kinase At4g31250 [Capsella rubella]EOA18255.1 hypothetical protein CARUB_v10006748mg [Capsella rubella]
MSRDEKFPIVYSVLLIAFYCFVGTISADGDADALLKFKSSLANATALGGWDSGEPPCSGEKGSNSKWKGVMCSNGSVFAIRLENMSLSGELDVQALASMGGLKSVSFMRNYFEGDMPRGLNGLVSLVHLYLAHNRFSGEIDGDLFAGMKALVKVHLEGNRFSGEIPKSLAKLPKLTELNLEDNLFTGKLPTFKQKNLVTVNVANNRLEGRIPFTLGLMNPAFFSGNKGLCGAPLLPCRYTRPPFFTVFLLALTVLAVIVLITVFLSVCILGRRQGKGQDQSHGHVHAPVYGQTEQQYSEKSSQDSKVYRKLANESVQRDSTATSGALSVGAQSPEEDKRGDQRKLHFVRNDQERFTLQDMLRASAEVLGSGGFGSSYKAALSSGRAVVVKRFRFMSNVGREEFYDHMKKIGRLSHPNLLPLVAFYYRKEEKLLVTNYISNGSLANLLHANRTPGQVVLDWPIRFKIVRGVTRGLAYLYRVFSDLNLPHGHLKSSNVLLDHNFEPLLTDYALVPVVNRDQSQQFMVAYKAPEFTQQDRTSRRSDVWSLGILILEILTGKFPANYLRQGKGADDELAAWVESVARTEWTADVFDKEMKAGKEHEAQMLKLLKIGLRCCDWDIEKRIELHEAVDRIEEVGEVDREAGGGQESVRSSYVTASEGDHRSSRAMTGEFSLM